MHSVKISSDEEGRTRLILDGVDVSANCYRLTFAKEGHNDPVLTIELGCGCDFEVSAASAMIRKLPGPRQQARQRLRNISVKAKKAIGWRRTT